ncbi:autotransporter outer membrane beta-barrel domain-containing protein [Parasedimentitalea psychrophila]|uniref:Autotransporter outer membrane beta-barrel domain-containing protein n=1 Tax=Parasedimentitalea psychrophila TaxID=2997337 RepID=A0A9Y2L0U4_9RHOB|nr:autotransporter outer membrane beta-barrel domain-containing protein [Parasedimentitalea psychrophila]WIY25974.1 autotransporter outer membrane beta-barrel domain-containing protein [Parasedimentitalea psychrophila]
MQKRSLIRAGLLAMACMAPTVGLGFTAADAVSGSIRIDATSCDIGWSVDATGFTAVSIWINAVLSEEAGGSYFASSVYSTVNADPITISGLAQCLGTPSSNISGLSQDGADGSFASDTYIGFSFTLGTAVGSLGAGPHEFSSDGTTPVVPDTSVEETQKTIARFLHGRANQLISNQPDLTGFLSGTVGGEFDVNVTRGLGNFNLAAGAEQPVWIQLRGAWSKDDGADSRAVFGALGSHRKISETVLLGAMLQFDHQSQDEGDMAIEGTGWLAGPYVVAKMVDQPLFLEARMLYGQSSNTVTPFGTHSDDFDTSRLLTQIQVSGDVYQGRTRFSPFLNAAYAAEEQKTYQDSLGNLVPTQKVELMQMALGLDATQPVPLKGGDLELRAGVSGIWSNTGGTEVAESILPGYSGWRGKVNLGLNYVSNTSGTFALSAYLDGLGAQSYESYGLQLDYSLAF